VVAGRENEMKKELLALFVGIVLAYLLGEILTRIFVPDPAIRFENDINLFQEDNMVGYKNKPNFRGYAQGWVLVETNSLGYRGKEVSLPKPNDTFRILGLGDSVMWGVGIREQDTYIRILERLLNAKVSPKNKLRFETVNTAVVGYSTYQELLTLQRDGVPLYPNLLVVGFEENDFYPTEDPFYNVHKFHQPSKHDVRRRTYPEEPPVRFYFYRFLRSQMRKLKYRLTAKGTNLPRRRNDWLPGSFEARAWPFMQDQFRSMKRLADDHGFRLLILLFPTYDKPGPIPDHPFPQTRVGEFLTSEKIDYLDLSNAFRGREREAFLDSMHLTPSGHQLTAEEVFLYLENRGWLREASSNIVRVVGQ
jgi:lysophospholipase L1-like esterase